MTTIRVYSELRQLKTFLERYRYLSLRGVVAQVTFGYDRHMNQQFYRSSEWRRIRNEVIVRDEGCDLGVPGHEIHTELLVHHMNPMAPIDIERGGEELLDPRYLITTQHQTHNAIHYGDEGLLPQPFVERRYGDTKLW